MHRKIFIGNFVFYHLLRSLLAVWFKKSGFIERKVNKAFTVIADNDMAKNVFYLFTFPDQSMEAVES